MKSHLTQGQRTLRPLIYPKLNFSCFDDGDNSPRQKHRKLHFRATLNMPLGTEESAECSEEQGGCFLKRCLSPSVFFPSLFLSSRMSPRFGLLLLPEPDVPDPRHLGHSLDGQPHVLPCRPLPLHVLQVFTIGDIPTK